MRTLLFFTMMAVIFSAVAKNKTQSMKHINLEQLVQSHISKNDIVSLCDSQNFEHIDLNILEEVNAEAVDEVYSYLRGIYAVPIIEASEKPLDNVLKSIIGDVMVYKLYKRRGGVIPENIKDNYKICVDRLRDIRSGKMLIDIAKPDIANRQMGSILYQTSDQQFGDKFTKLL